jgi:hypothetical protein
MRQIQNLGDSRQSAFCVHCGQSTGTRDHVPSRVFLDEPFPENLPTVPACAACNSGHSTDEEYLACLLDCVLTGGVGVSPGRRPKVARILQERPRLASRILAAISGGETPVFAVEHKRVTRVVLKLARGHVLFELNEPHPEEPAQMNFAPLRVLSPEQVRRFEENPAGSMWPEVGSRAMQRIVEDDAPTGWIIVQPGRYRFLAAAGDSGLIVRFVLSEYLAAEVVWEY